jgi:hypothetical protein
MTTQHTAQFELDSGILEKLMSTTTGLINSINNNLNLAPPTPTNESTNSNAATMPVISANPLSKASKKLLKRNNKQLAANNLVLPTTTTTKRIRPILQVLNIQNIAVPIANFTSIQQQQQQQQHKADSDATKSSAAPNSSSLSSDRYLLIYPMEFIMKRHVYYCPI